MPFNSYLFIFIFLPTTVLGYYSLIKFDKVPQGKWWLLFTSLIFYGFYIPKNLPILLLSIAVNFYLGKYLRSCPGNKLGNKKIVFIMGLTFNIILLSFFKYAHFYLSFIIFPLGISFYTISQIAYLVDTYQGLTKDKKIIDYALFVSFFPHLLAGPIVQFKDLANQHESLENKKFNSSMVSLGIYLFVLGLVKKVLISDSFSDLTNPGFGNVAQLEFFSSWKTSITYTFQLYFDFSGYSDMAVGIGAMFNLKIPQNFNSPLKSISIIDFWNRWHITLSQFIRTYIFTPIAKALPSMSFSNIMLATFLSMIIAGIWHGAGWTFLVYGMVHGIGLVINHLWKKRKIKIPIFFSWLITFLFINSSFVIFRATSLSDAFAIFKAMLGLNGVVVPKIFGIKKVGILSNYGLSMGTLLQPSDYTTILMLLATMIFIKKSKNTNYFQKEFKETQTIAILTSVCFVLSLYGLNRVTEFIYFNF